MVYLKVDDFSNFLVFSGTTWNPDFPMLHQTLFLEEKFRCRNVRREKSKWYYNDLTMSQKLTQLSSSIKGRWWGTTQICTSPQKGDTHEQEYRIHHAFVWCLHTRIASGLRKFLSDRQSDALEHPIEKHVLCALDSKTGVFRPHAYE